MEKFKKLNKKVKIAIAIIAALIIGTAGYLYNNYTAYNDYMEEFKVYNYENEDFYYDNKLVKSETLSYMQSELDNVAKEMNDTNKELDVMLEELAITEVEDKDTLSETIDYKETLIKDELQVISDTYGITKFDYDADVTESFEVVETAITERISTNTDVTVKSKDLTDGEKTKAEKLNTRLDTINEIDIETLTLNEKVSTLEDAKVLKSDVTTFNTDVADRIEEEEKEAQEEASASTTSTRNYSSTYDSGSSYDYSSGSSSYGSSNNSNNSSSSSNSNSGGGTTSYMCPYMSESSALAAGAASGRGYAGINCGDGSWDVYLYDGDNGSGDVDSPFDIFD